MERTELISRLSSDLRPMRPTPSLALRVSSWIIVVMLFAVVSMLMLGTRADVYSILYSPRFVIESLAILFAGIASGILALILTTPGQKTRTYLLTAVLSGVVWVLSVSVAFFLQSQFQNLQAGLMLTGIMCSKRVVLLAVLPAIFLTFLLRMGTGLTGKLAGTLVFIAAGLFGLFILQFNCPKDHSVHLFVYHILPVVALGVLGWSIGIHLCGFEAKLRKKKEQILDTSS